MNPINTTISSNAPLSITEVNLAVLRMSLKTIETAGDNMIKIMEQSVQPNLGQNIDIKI